MTEDFLQSGNFTFDGQTYSYAGLTYGASNSSPSLNDSPLPSNVSLENTTFLLVNPGMSVLKEVTTNGSPYTFQYVHTSFQIPHQMANFRIRFIVDEQSAGATEGLQGFTLIPSLAGLNRTLTLIFTTFSAEYTELSDDLLLPAHKKDSFTTQVHYSNVTQTVYLPDNIISVLACILWTERSEMHVNAASWGAPGRMVRQQ